MYDVEKCFTVLENAAGFTRWDAYTHIYTVLQQNGDIGVRLYFDETNFIFPRMLYKSECHQCWVPRGSDTSACPRGWLESIGVLCQVLEAHKNLVGRIIKEYEKVKWSNSDYEAFPSHNLRLHLGTLSHLAPLNKPIHDFICSSSQPFRLFDQRMLNIR